MWGVPDVITSDRGPQFVSDLWIEMCKLMGIARSTTTSYHPQHNGKIETMHRCLKNSLRAGFLGRPNWLAELPWVCWGYAQLPTWRQGCLHHCWSPDSNPLYQASWLLSGLTLTMHLRLEESYLGNGKSALRRKPMA